MYRTKLCMSVSDSYGMDSLEQIRLLKQIGFDGFFTMWDDRLAEYRALADATGMLYQSIHAPFGKVRAMWQDTEEGRSETELLIRCVRDAAAVSVPIVVVHPYIGFEAEQNPTEIGLVHFEKVVRVAEETGVQIAFENVEGEAYLAALMERFADSPAIGFCWDSGHELCYNRGKDMLALYGDRLIATHLNDNLGVSRFDGEIFWTDDLHLLPFDGIHDWRDVADRMNACGYDGVLTFELNKASKPDRYENDKYQAMSVVEYFTACYERACRVAYLKNGMDR